MQVIRSSKITFRLLYPSTAFKDKKECTVSPSTVAQMQDTLKPMQPQYFS
jgi:hypothetical protein